MTRVQKIDLVIGWTIVILLATSVVLFLLGITAGIITLAHWITAE